MPPIIALAPPPPQYVRGYAPPGGMVDTIAPGKLSQSPPVYDTYVGSIRGNYQLPEGASMNTFASIPSNGLVNSAHHSVSLSQRLTPSAPCQNVFMLRGRDSYGNPIGEYANVSARLPLPPTPRQIIANAAADTYFPPGGPFPKTT
jgi:hypothetical protein